MEADQVVLMEEEPELDDLFTQNLIRGVIDGISQSSAEGRRSHHKKRSNMRKKGGRSRKVPEFELADIMGEFDIDDTGNYIILRGAQGQLLDKNDRLVNRRGYLSDKFGNVVDKNGQVVFRATDLDSDDEIPASFVFEKRQKNLMNLADQENLQVKSFGNMEGNEARAGAKHTINTTAGMMQQLPGVASEDDLVERELAMLRQAQKSGRSGNYGAGSAFD